MTKRFTLFTDQADGNGACKDYETREGAVLAYAAEVEGGKYTRVWVRAYDTDGSDPETIIDSAIAAAPRFAREGTMDINEAQRIIQAEADKLTAALRQKGYDSHAEIWIGREGFQRCTAYTPCKGAALALHGGGNFERLTDLLAEVSGEIEALPHKDEEALAYADELAQPLFLMSEQHAQAAE